MRPVFYLTFFTVFYTYLGYPLVLFAVAVFRQKKIVRQVYPSVSLIIAAYNEETSIDEKIRNSLEINYPEDKFEIIVVSDGSTDKTNEIVNSFTDNRLKLLALDKNGGQCAAFDSGASAANGEVLVFSDATGMFKRDAVMQLVKHFYNEKVGCVSGTITYRKEGSKVGENIGLYWRYEKLIKKLQSRAFSTITISGAIYAIRKELYECTHPELGSDMYVPMTVLSKGYKVVFEPKAVTNQLVTHMFDDELSRRTRIPVRGLTTLVRSLDLINPIKHPFISFHMISHKGFRWLAPVFLIMLFVSNLAVYGLDGIYGQLLLLQTIFYTSALFGFGLKNIKTIAIFNVPYYFCLLNVGALLGLVKFLSGERISTWQPSR